MVTEKVTLQRANVVLTVANDPSVIAKYKEKGYSVINSHTGAVIEQAVPHDINELQRIIIQLQKTIAEKDAKIADLELQLKAPIDEESAEDEPVQKKTTTKSKSSKSKNK